MVRTYVEFKDVYIVMSEEACHSDGAVFWSSKTGRNTPLNSENTQITITKLGELIILPDVSFEVHNMI